MRYLDKNILLDIGCIKLIKADWKYIDNLWLCIYY